MDSAGRTGNMIALLAMVVLAFVLMIILVVMYLVTRRLISQYGWRVVRRVHRMPLSSSVYATGTELAALIVDDLRQYGSICPEIFHCPVWPMREPAATSMGDGNFSIRFGGSTYRVSIQQDRTPGRVTVSRIPTPRQLFIAVACIATGLRSGHLAGVVLGLVSILPIALLDPYGFGFMIAQSVQRVAGGTSARISI